MARVYNFSAGPSMLPEEVLKKAAAEMLDYQGSGQSVMEMSHRSKWFDAIIKENLLNSGVSEESFGYKTDKDRIYHEYYVESEFNKFVCEMKSGYPEHY